MRSRFLYGVKVTGVFYDFFHSFHCLFSWIYSVIQRVIYTFFLVKTVGGGAVNELRLRFIILLLHGFYCVFSVMSEINLDEPGFTAPAVSTAPPSSDSSVDNPPEGRRKCVACPRRMSAKTADRHTICIACRGFDCSLKSRCEECIEWPEEEFRLYAKLRKSLKSKGSSKHRSKPSASPPPSADSVPSSRPSAIAHMQTQVDSLNALVNTSSESLLARMVALQASLATSSSPQSSSPTWLGKDAVLPQPGQTAGEGHMFQALGVDSRTFGANAQFFGQDVRAPRQELVGPSAAPQLHAAPGPAPQLLLHLCIMGILLPSRPHQGGFLRALLLLVLSVVRTLHRSRRLAMRRARSPLMILLQIAWQNSFMRSVRLPVRFRTMLISCAATLRVGSVSLSLSLLATSSGCTPELRR